MRRQTEAGGEGLSHMLSHKVSVAVRVEPGSPASWPRLFLFLTAPVTPPAHHEALMTRRNCLHLRHPHISTLLLEAVAYWLAGVSVACSEANSCHF